MSIFDKRVNIKPYEYPEIIEYANAIRHSYWLHTEFNFTSDIQDFKLLAKKEKSVIEKSMLAIAQIEVNVKTFWWDVYKHIPKPEIGIVGQTFSESEARHLEAYSHLLEILGLNSKFEEIDSIPAIIDRIGYLDKVMEESRTRDDKKYTRAILLFSLFVEHVSLFSQFLIIMSFNKERNIFKGISNTVEATSKEENIHGLFGTELIRIIKKEHPEFFDEEMKSEVEKLVMKAYKAENKILDWIFEEGELDFLSKYTVQEFLKDRFNTSLKSIGFDWLFEVDEEELDKTEWFDNEVLATKHVDFFVKRSINYNKKSKAITEDDLFD